MLQRSAKSILLSQAQMHFIRSLSLSSSVLSSKKPSKFNLSGVWPPLATNFHADGQIDTESVKKNLEKYEKFDMKGYVAFGSNGESVMFTLEERAKHVELLRSNTNKPIIVGVNAESTRCALKQCDQLVKSGADALLVATPSFFKSSINHKSLVSFYTEVANGAQKPVIIYNVPPNTGVDIGVETVLHLAKHPNIIGMKESQTDIPKIIRIVHETQGDDFQVVVGSGNVLMPGLLMGSVGGVMALANVLPGECVKLFNLVKEGKLDEARILQGRLVEPNTLITRVFGVPGMKAALEMFGYCGGPCRAPLQSLPAEDKEKIRKAFVRHNFLEK